MSADLDSAQAEPDPTECEQTLVRRSSALSSAPPAAALAHVLLLRDASGQTRRIPLDDTPLTIGRGAQNGLVLTSPEVSRRHCSVVVAGAGAVLTDHGSTNGVHVDGARVAGAAALRPGARLNVGPFLLSYQQGSAADLAEAEAREQEQARAVAYIQALLPPPEPLGPVRVAWRFVPSAQLGGDAFGYAWLDPQRFAVFLLDVSGHGVGSALLAASAANMLRARNLAADPADPGAVLAALNRAFQMEEQNGLFFSLWYGVYDRAGRRLRYASAGHHPAILSSAAGLHGLATRAPAVGMAPAPRFAAAEAVVPEGGRLYLFSDGAFEVTLACGRAGSIRDLVGLLGRESQAAAPAGQSEPDRVFEAMRALAGRRPFEDDVSILALDFD